MMSPAINNVRINPEKGKKKHQGKPAIVCVYVSPRAVTALSSDETFDADETTSIDNYLVRYQLVLDISF
jgi:hypothetical protein